MAARVAALRCGGVGGDVAVVLEIGGAGEDQGGGSAAGDSGACSRRVRRRSGWRTCLERMPRHRTARHGSSASARDFEAWAL